MQKCQTELIKSQIGSQEKYQLPRCAKDTTLMAESKRSHISLMGKEVYGACRNSTSGEIHRSYSVSSLHGR